MENHRIISVTTNTSNLFWVFILTIAFTTSARILDEEPSDQLPVAPEASNAVTKPVTNPGVAAANTGVVAPNPGVAAVNPGVATTSGATVPNTDPHHTLTFFMHDILGGSKPSARAVTGVVSNPAVNGQLPFVKPNGANLPFNNGVPQNANNNGLINNNNIPFLTGLGGTTQAVLQNNGNNMFNNVFNFPAATGGQLSSGSTLQQLMYGTITVIDDELTEGHELGSGFLGKAQGFYAVCSIDGTSQTMAFTTMFQSGHYVDSLSFFGVHRIGVSESQLAIMGGTGKYVNAKGVAIVKTIPASATTQQDTDGVETVLEFTVYVSY